MWYSKGRYHRIGGPAVIDWDRSYTWFFEGKYHSSFSPAIYSHITGEKMWYKHGKHHRIDGPASLSETGVYISLYSLMFRKVENKIIL